MNNQRFRYNFIGGGNQKHLRLNHSQTPLVLHLKYDSCYEIGSKFDCEPLDAHTSLFTLLHFVSTFKRMPNYEQIEGNLITVNPFGVAPFHRFGIVVTFLSILSAQTVK